MEDDQYRLLPDSTGNTSGTFGRAVLPTAEVVRMSIKNMFEAVISNGNHEEDKNKQMTDGSGLMMDEGGDNLGNSDGPESDDMGGFDDDLGDLDEASGGANTDELEHRLDELEKEVSSLSSTVSTVRSENEQISESVEDVEEDVRKLLDIYEMVTRGVNPFTDDIESGMQGRMGSERSFGLFDEQDDNQGEEIDEDTMNADPEGFFDEELSEDASGEDLAADGSLDETSDDPGDDGGFFDEDSLDDGDEEQNGSTTFQDLKAEYDSGDGEWATEEESEDETTAEEETADEVSETEDTREADEWFSDEPGEKEVQNVTVAADTDSELNSGPDPKPTAEETDESTSESKSTAGSGKPYLVTLPSRYTGDLIVMEWLEYLVQQAGYRQTTRAIEYYQKIDWIGKRSRMTSRRWFEDSTWLMKATVGSLLTTTRRASSTSVSWTKTVAPRQ